MTIIIVIGIFTSIFFMDYGKNSNTFALERAANRAAQDLNRAQEMSMGGMVGDSTTNGYGVYFDKTSGSETQYIIYKNNNSNAYYDSLSPADTIYETVTMERGVKICNILIDTTSTNSASVFFEPPEPITYINSYYSGHELFIVLCSTSDATKTRTVKINNTGRIETSNP